MRGSKLARVDLMLNLRVARSIAVNPDARVLVCYESAYRIVMQFLACIG